MGKQELPAILVLRHHAELAHALAWHLGIPGYFAGLSGGADRFFFRGFSAGIESEKCKGDAEANQFHDVENADEFVK